MAPIPFRRLLILLLAVTMMLPVAGPCQEKSGGAPQRPPAPVTVVPVVNRQVARQVTLVGSVEALATSVVAAEVGGVVASFPAKEGRQVSRGDLLVRLKAHQLELELKGRAAERERIKANLENARKELDRVGRLRENKSLPQRTYDDALYAHRALAQALLVAESQIDTLAYRIEQKTVVAPFDGFVAAEHTQVGQWIQPGGPVVTLVDISRVRVSVDVPERYAVQMAPDARVRVAITSLAGDVREGTIDVILPKGDAMTRTFPVRVLFDNPGFSIKAGMEAVATFDLSERFSALMVPKDAVVTAGDRSLVYRVADAKAFAVAVAVEGYHDGLAAVSGDLEAGDMVVVRGNERLRPGQDVAAAEDGGRRSEDGGRD
ncbi:cation efflux system (czcB-like) [Desulfosarcina alkanivorans]|uniref:Cation efflux system (CzcB-like) n=1 Tax=Desulfosarcina alkanivorans TaxID=571177 RepID=A0A5K7YPW0_9BACT|nr:efflux RND transporter periplasmic adaptor subunit [Desulfosarcina alkanivorans]BBO71296.1 cation efflux system (czcB-like) [Desulfosarcina alkanivorans]